jgi:hypothetical protein
MSSEYTDRVYPETYKVGKLLVDSKSRYARRTDNFRVFKLSPGEITLLRILDQEDWISVSDIAFQFETSKYLNKAMLVATSLNGSKSDREKLVKSLDNFDLIYPPPKEVQSEDISDIRPRGFRDKKNKAQRVTKGSIWEKISRLGKKIGADLIENNVGFGYRLRRE